jgi:hypothetical protein
MTYAPLLVVSHTDSKAEQLNPLSINDLCITNLLRGERCSYRMDLPIFNTYTTGTGLASAGQPNEENEDRGRRTRDHLLILERH